MRLTCPNCSAIYEIEAGLIPGGGSHVQCSACETRWFEREREPEAPQLSEDQIIARLETRPRLAAVASVRPAPEPAAVRPEPRPAAPAPKPVEAPDTVVTPLRPRSGAERPAAARKPALPIRRKDRFGLGFASALAVTGLGLGAYMSAEELARRLPVGAGAVLGYAARVDAERERIEARLGPLRDQAMDTVFPEG